MDASTAKARLKTMTASASKPTLSETEIDQLISMFSVADANLNAPNSVGWAPTYNLRAAAKEGWKWKMGKASELISTDLDGDRMSAQQIFDHCKEMMNSYSGTASAAMGTTVSTGETNVAAKAAFN